MRKRIKIILIAVAFVTAFIITFQAITIHNMKKGQEEQFSEHITAAAQGFEDYREKGNSYWYDVAVRELHSACSIAGLLSDSDDYQNAYHVLLSLGKMYSCRPDDPVLFADNLELVMDDIIAALNDFSTDRNVENLYTKLYSINLNLNKMRVEQAEKMGLNICY